MESVAFSNLTRTLHAVGARGLYLGFTSSSCAHCSEHEAEWQQYADASASSEQELPWIVRVDSDRSRKLVRRHEVQQLPTLVLAWSSHWINYAGPHTAAALTAFGAAQLSPVSVEVHSREELEELISEHSPPPKMAVGGTDVAASSAQSPPLLLVGFFTDPADEEADELEDFLRAATELRRLRTDVAVRAAHVTLTPELRGEFIGRRRWVQRAPSAVLLVGGHLAHGPPGTVRGGAYALDESGHQEGLSLSEWAVRMAVPELGELTHQSFAAYAATNLPMLIAFVDPAAANEQLELALRAVGARFRGRLCSVYSDGLAMRTRMLALGLDPDASLPQLAMNTKDGRQLPFPARRKPTEAALAAFAADFLGGRLRPPAKPVEPPASPRLPMEEEADTEGLSTRRVANGSAPVELSQDTFDRIALDVTRDVLLLLTAKEGCESCVQLTRYYSRVAERAPELGLQSLVVATFDVKRQVLPSALKAVDLHALPTILMLPARRKEPPFALYSGDARPKELLYFVQKHASFAFELPPNPHLTREQHEAWTEQVGQLPAEKAQRAFEKLQRETGLERDEL
jgi:hypothetical protein